MQPGLDGVLGDAEQGRRLATGQTVEDGRLDDGSHLRAQPLEGAAEELLATAGASREVLVPLVRAAVENWAALGPERALTGPIARGDEATVERQRAAFAAWDAQAARVYAELSAMAGRLKATGSTRAEDAPDG